MKAILEDCLTCIVYNPRERYAEAAEKLRKAIAAFEDEQRQRDERDAKIREAVVQMRGYEYQDQEYGGSGLYEQCGRGQGRYLDRREVLALLDGEKR